MWRKAAVQVRMPLTRSPGQWNVGVCVGWRCSEGERRGPGWVLGAKVYAGRSCQLFLEQDHYTGVYCTLAGAAPSSRVGVMMCSTLRQKVNSSKKKKKKKGKQQSDDDAACVLRAVPN